MADIRAFPNAAPRKRASFGLVVGDEEVLELFQPIRRQLVERMHLDGIERGFDRADEPVIPCGLSVFRLLGLDARWVTAGPSEPINCSKRLGAETQTASEQAKRLPTIQIRGRNLPRKNRILRNQKPGVEKPINCPEISL